MEVVDETREVEVNDRAPRLGLGLERARTEVELEVLDHSRLAGLSLAYEQVIRAAGKSCDPERRT